MKLCPKCHGVGLVETAIGGHWCRECRGTGHIQDQPPGKRVEPSEKSRSAPAQEKNDG